MKLRVVIVDDHDGFRSEARSLLEDEGYDVAGEAVDGRGAIAEVKRTTPDLVLLDVQLPDMNGFDVADEIERAAPATKVVMVSAREASDFGDRLTRRARPFISKRELSGMMLERRIGETG